ncbi:MAG TPA: PQQ-binding-like beta-propeller repeat protein [Solirubrobacteraceae bacterium]|nr:PQQ-binding-like beta-propeller repeat protein [Solirubrobacteraceae bacterium]
MLSRLLPALLLGLFAASAPPASAGWTTFNASSARAGVVSGAPVLRRLTRSYVRNLDGEVYGQPLFAAGKVYVATENNSVYAFGARDGRLVFARHLGAPVPGHSLPCGNIDPSGITGTPVIYAGRIYAVAYLRRGHRHVLYGLDPSSGRVLVRAETSPPGRSRSSQQRGALLGAHGRIYVPYGGLNGDCGHYRGYVVSVTAAGRSRQVYVNPSPHAGIWAVAGLSLEPGGSLLAATGNGAGAGPYSYANSVIRLSSGLRRLASWAPADWRALSGGADLDIGSIAPVALPDGSIFQSGKSGFGYRLAPRLGGVGAEAYRARICDMAVYGAAAVAPPYVLVPCLSSLVALRLTPRGFEVAWRTHGKSASPIVAGGAAISMQSGHLRAVGLKDGRPLADVVLGEGSTSFPLISGNGDLIAAGIGARLVVLRVS